MTVLLGAIAGIVGLRVMDHNEDRFNKVVSLVIKKGGNKS